MITFNRETNKITIEEYPILDDGFDDSDLSRCVDIPDEVNFSL